MKQLTIIAFAGLALLAGCSQEPACGKSKEAFLQDYYSLINEVKASKLPASDGKWEAYDERFRAYVEECYEQYESELSAKERRRFWSGSLRYYAQRYGYSAIKKLEAKKDKASEKVKEEVEKIWTDVEEALEETSGKIKPERLLKLKPDKAATE